MKNFLSLISMLALAFASCQHSHNENHSDNEPEELKILLTAYSSDFEVFAEADPFVAGRTSKVLSHFSHLPGFGAVETGSIKLRLIIGQKEVSQILDQPTRKGIYSFEIKPGMEGKGQIIYDIKIGKNDFQLIVPDITVYSEEGEAGSFAKSAEPSKTNTVAFTKEQTWKIEFATELPITESFGQVIKTSAKVSSAQSDEVIVCAKTNGVVIFKGDNILEGKNIKNGEDLFSISGSGLAENNSKVRFTEAQNNFLLAKADYERKAELAKDKIVSEKDLITAKRDFENAKAVFENLNKNFSEGGQSVSFSMNGFIKQLFVKNGQYVEVGQPLVSISQNQILLLSADVQQKYATLLGSVISANVKTIPNSKTYSFEQLNGKILSYGRNANSDNYLIPISIQIDNTGDFIPGGFVELYLKTISGTSALTVPNSALLEETGHFYVFVQKNPELFERREVTLGSTDGLKTEIKNGISKNERVVTKGAILIKGAQSSGKLDAHSGHNH